MHYYRWRRHGDVGVVLNRKDLSVADRFWRHVDRTDAEGCWPWTGYVGPNGYATFAVSSAYRTNAHRVAFVLAVGRPRRTEVVDHLCRNPVCCNPAHLEAVTPATNIARGIGPVLTAARMRARQSCPAGHPYDEANTYIDPHGYRKCRTCRRAAAQRYRELARIIARFPSDS